MNDIANLCEVVGADVTNVRRGIGSDSRIGNKFIYAGAGYGGSCFPKDVKAIIKTAQLNNYNLRILEAVENVNDDQKKVIISKIKSHFPDIKGKTFAMWGLSFKPQTDDMREAPSVVIANALVELGAKVKAYDPVAMEEAQHILGDTIEYGEDQYDVLIDADALILITEWPEFRVPNYKVMDKLLKEKVVFDGRNIYDPEEMKEFGYTYYSIGRPTICQ
jgi:UDPglucose 6-dehydrogenase